MKERENKYNNYVIAIKNASIVKNDSKTLINKCKNN